MAARGFAILKITSARADIEQELWTSHAPAAMPAGPKAATPGPKPRWLLLYALVPLSFLLFALADFVPPNPWRRVVEILAVSVLFGLAFAWVRLNCLALTRSSADPD